jgi:hypothetical protein
MLMTSSRLAILPSVVLVRTLIDYFSSIPNAQQAQIDCTKDNIEWARNEKRVFLRQSLETKLAGLYVSRSPSLLSTVTWKGSYN